MKPLAGNGACWPSTVLTVVCVAAGSLSAICSADTNKSAASPKRDADILATMPVLTGTSPVDTSVSVWVAKARKAGKDDGVWVGLGDALMQKAREADNPSFYYHAERAYRKSLALNPKSPDAMAGMAWVAGERHEFEKSIDWADKALALDPRNSTARGLLGDAAVESGDYDLAFRHYQEMLDIRPDLSSYSRGAHLLFLTGDTSRAFLLMDKAIRAGAPYAENTAWCRAQLVRMNLSTGNVLPAQRLAASALEYAPDNIHVLEAMANVEAARKDFPAAIRHYRKAIEKVPDVEAIAMLGDLYAVNGDSGEARKQYERAEAIFQRNKDRGLSGDVHTALFLANHDRRLPEALEMAQALFKAYPNVYAADALAWCLYKKGRYLEAQETIRHALRWRTPEAVFSFHAGMIEMKLGNPASARKYLSEALSLNPAFHPVFGKQAEDALRELATRPGAEVSEAR